MFLFIYLEGYIYICVTNGFYIIHLSYSLFRDAQVLFEKAIIVSRRDLRTSPKTRWLCGPALCWRPHFHSKGEQLSEVSKIGCTRKMLRMYRHSKSFLDSQDGKK